MKKVVTAALSAIIILSGALYVCIGRRGIEARMWNYLKQEDSKQTFKVSR